MVWPRKAWKVQLAHLGRPGVGRPHPAAPHSCTARTALHEIQIQRKRRFQGLPGWRVGSHQGAAWWALCSNTPSWPLLAIRVSFALAGSCEPHAPWQQKDRARQSTNATSMERRSLCHWKRMQGHPVQQVSVQSVPPGLPAMVCSSCSEKTLPMGLWGVFTTTSLVWLPNAACSSADGRCSRN